jgi:hypothetical protein
MAGFSRFYVIGGLGGFMGADGVNPIEMMIMVGEGNRQWLEPRYFDTRIKPLGKLKTIIPAGPDHPDALLDACIAFYPRLFRECHLLKEVESSLGDAERLDFDARPLEIPKGWYKLREEARPIFTSLNIWLADLVPHNRK